MDKSADAFRTISEAAGDLDVPQHVLRFWETRFSQIKPMKRGGGRRYYRPEDMELLRAIRRLLYGEGYTIKGVQRIPREQGARAVIALRADGERPAAPREEAPVAPPSGAEPGAGEGPESAGEFHALMNAALSEIAAARRVLAAARGG